MPSAYIWRYIMKAGYGKMVANQVEFIELGNHSHTKFFECLTAFQWNRKDRKDEASYTFKSFAAGKANFGKH